MGLRVELGSASSWLSARARREQDGVLCVLRVGPQERLAYGSLLDGDAAEIKGYKTVFVKWPAQDKSSISFCLENAPLVVVECLLFLLRAGNTTPRTTPRASQRIDLIGRSSLELNAQDLNAVKTAAGDSVAFLSTLDGNLGFIELRLRSPEQQRAATEECETQGSFSVNWSSTEALAKDLAEKGASSSCSWSRLLDELTSLRLLLAPARLKAEGERKLLLRLKAVETKETLRLQIREQSLRQLQLVRAASTVCRAYRQHAQSRREALEKARQELLQQEQARKAKLRDAVLARNQKRSQLMRERLQGRHPVAQAAAAHVESRDVRCEMERLATKEHRKLQQRLEQIQSAYEQRMHSTVEPSDGQYTQQMSASPLDPELVHAVRLLHLQTNLTKVRRT